MLLRHQKFCAKSHVHLLQAMAQTGRGCARPEQPSLRLTFRARTVSKLLGVPALQLWGLTAKSGAP